MYNDRVAEQSTRSPRVMWNVWWHGSLVAAKSKMHKCYFYNCLSCTSSHNPHKKIYVPSCSSQFTCRKYNVQWHRNNHPRKTKRRSFIELESRCLSFEHAICSLRKTCFQRIREKFHMQCSISEVNGRKKCHCANWNPKHDRKKGSYSSLAQTSRQRAN